MMEKIKRNNAVMSAGQSPGKRSAMDDVKLKTLLEGPDRLLAESSGRLMTRMGIGEDLISSVNRLLLSNPGEFPRLDSVARRLSLGARTLRRRLQELGTSYQKLLDEIRCELATEYLRSTNLTIQEIAELLGYSEVTNFRRAFLRWAEISPYQYRKRFVTL